MEAKITIVKSNNKTELSNLDMTLLTITKTAQCPNMINKVFLEILHTKPIAPM